MAESTVIKCPNCGDTETYVLPLEGRKCKYCKVPIFVKEYKEAAEVAPVKRSGYIALLNSLAAQNPDMGQIQLALGLFYLVNGGYQFAVPKLKKAIELDPMNADTYFYLAIAMLGGKRPFQQQTPVIKEIWEQIGLAEALEPKAIYYYFHAFIAFDFYKKKFLRISPSYEELKLQAKNFGLTVQDINELFNMLKIVRPQDF